MWETEVQPLGQEDLLEEGMATHSSILARGIPWIEESVGYSPWGRKELNMTEQLTHTETYMWQNRGESPHFCTKVKGREDPWEGQNIKEASAEEACGQGQRGQWSRMLRS